MHFLSTCGTELPVSARFCSNCGASFPPDYTPQAAGSPDCGRQIAGVCIAWLRLTGGI